MRWFYLAVIVLFAVATLVFAMQNFEIVTVSFFGFKLRAARAYDDCRLRPRRGDGR
jgi:lipopolysaccharide assembly protein A